MRQMRFFIDSFVQRLCICAILTAFSYHAFAADGQMQSGNAPGNVAVAAADSTEKAPSMNGKFRNDEYKVYIVVDIDSQKVMVPGQEIFGEMAGYLGAERDSRLWFFTAAERISTNKAKVWITNDYGSEDLEATLTLNADGSVSLKQGSGSRIKIVVDRKWQKLPSELVFVPAKR